MYTAEQTKCQSSSDTIALFGYSSVNCTGYIPSTAYAVMQKWEATALSNYMYSVPEGYLACCLHGITYDNDISPFAFTLNAKFQASFAMNDFVSLDFDGNLETKMTLHIEWLEPRLMWMSSVTGLNHWTWQSTVLYPAHRLWLPQFEVVNCAAEKCLIVVRNDSFLALSSSGTIDVDNSVTVRSNCSRTSLTSPSTTRAAPL